MQFELGCPVDHSIDPVTVVARGAAIFASTVALDTPRTAGIDPSGILFAASPADIRHVMVDGREIVSNGEHAIIDVPYELREAICALY